MNFRQRVWALVREIPEGRVMGYGQVATVLGSPGAARQVGYAMAALEAGTDVPWQRVIHSDGTLATRGDPVRPVVQRGLLEREGVSFLGHRVDMARFGWLPT
ncbi:MAG: methylated-DNA--[protein]-cysteine S-methyltransferase [Deltaproteobacteria bacterium]|nr:methylated-DNA--[protein]-cysteine S-methyltransferase [Deltaproteobacteria bacterium]